MRVFWKFLTNGKRWMLPHEEQVRINLLFQKLPKQSELSKDNTVMEYFDSINVRDDKIALNPLHNVLVEKPVFGSSRSQVVSGNIKQKKKLERISKEVRALIPAIYI